jgi:hypothetical protein
MLLSRRGGMSVRMGRKGMLSLGDARGSMWPGPCRSWHFLVFSTIKGCHEGYIRLGGV